MVLNFIDNDLNMICHILKLLTLLIRQKTGSHIRSIQPSAFSTHPKACGEKYIQSSPSLQKKVANVLILLTQKNSVVLKHFLLLGQNTTFASWEAVELVALSCNNTASFHFTPFYTRFLPIQYRDGLYFPPFYAVLRLH